MGSDKGLKVLRPAVAGATGRGRFIFSDRYSIFDWGEMPDQIDCKGAATTLMGAYFFEQLERVGMNTHYIGLVEDSIVKKLSEVQKPVATMEVELLRVIPPDLHNGSYNYPQYTNELTTFLIPLEVIYRNSLHNGSSIFKRLEDGLISPDDFGINGISKPDMDLKEPIIDISTKLEITDRCLKWDEAQQISCLSENEIFNLKQVTHLVNSFITSVFSKIGIVNEGGKIEVGFDSQRNLMLVDVLGTLDECRFTMNGLSLSTGIAGEYYRNTPWGRDVEFAMKEDRHNWKEICRSRPPPLPPSLKKLISQVYCRCTNEITGKEWFEDIPSIKELCMEIRKVL